jgi:hypothetical protein
MAALLVLRIVARLQSSIARDAFGLWHSPRTAQRPLRICVTRPTPCFQ